MLKGIAHFKPDNLAQLSVAFEIATVEYLQKHRVRTVQREYTAISQHDQDFIECAKKVIFTKKHHLVFVKRTPLSCIRQV